MASTESTGASAITNEEMLKRIVRFRDLGPHGIPLMFIDSILPGHHRMNYALVGDTASENPEFKPLLTQPHQFQIGMVKAPPGNGPAWHTHDYVESFLPLSGRWRFYWGNTPEAIDGETVIDAWDFISLPPGLWRGFENIDSADAWLFAVLEPHSAFTGKDPYWPADIVARAREHGFEADQFGKMIKPSNYEEVRERMRRALEHEEG